MPWLAEAVGDAVVVAVTGTDVVTLRVVGGMVVPGIVVAGFIVAGTTVLPLNTLADIVCGVTVLGSIVVPGIVVVYVAAPPNALAGMALPTPALV